jgi:hypothetical protein
MLKFLRKDLLLVLSVAAVFFSLSYALGYVVERPPKTTELQTAFLDGEHAPRIQPAGGRVWRERALERVLTLGPEAVKDPAIVRAGDNDNIYVLDWADLRVKMFSIDGKLLKAFGQEKDTGPDAFANPTGFSVGPGGEVWVCDPRQRRIAGFNPDGSTQTVTPKSAIDRVTVVGNVLVTMAPPGSDRLFEVYNLSGERLKAFGELLEDQSGKGIILDGNIISDAESRGFIYGGRYIGVIAGYGAEGEQRFVVQTIGGTAPPKVLDVDGRRKINPNSTRSVLSMSLLGNELYVLSGARANGAAGASVQIMDVYDKRDGNYLYSLKLPVACKEAVVRPNYIYTLGDGGVTVWRFRQSA